MPKDFILYALFGGHFSSVLVVRIGAFLAQSEKPVVFMHIVS